MMKALEFETRVEAGSEISLPSEVRQQIQPGQRIRVLILLDDSDADADWARASVEAFFSSDDDIEELYSQP